MKSASSALTEFTNMILHTVSFQFAAVGASSLFRQLGTQQNPVFAFAGSVDQQIYDRMQLPVSGSQIEVESAALENEALLDGRKRLNEVCQRVLTLIDEMDDEELEGVDFDVRQLIAENEAADKELAAEIGLHNELIVKIKEKYSEIVCLDLSGGAQ